MRKKAEKVRKLHRMLNRALCQAHKVSTDGRCLPMQWWPVVKEWEEAVALARIKKEKDLVEKEEQSIPLAVKKEEPSSPKIPIKVEELPTPQLLYPSRPSRYTSLDPNTFNWGENAMVNQTSSHPYFGHQASVCVSPFSLSLLFTNASAIFGHPAFASVNPFKLTIIKNFCLPQNKTNGYQKIEHPNFEWSQLGDLFHPSPSISSNIGILGTYKRRSCTGIKPSNL